MSRTARSPWWVRHLLLLFALALVGVLLVIPMANILYEAFLRGPAGYLGALADPETIHAIYLTTVTAFLSVIVNLVFGVAASWAIAKYRFRGKSLLVTLIDLPFSVSPVISGLIFVLLFGGQTALGRWLDARHLQVLYAMPGIVIATIFVTFPFVAREVLPVMEAFGNEHEEAALTLGASGWQTFRLVTLPNIKWGLLYGVILCASRALGEFGAVSVVSGRIVRQTNTLSLQVEKLYQEYQAQAAFAVASVLLLLAVVTLIIKTAVEARLKQTLTDAARVPAEAA